MPEVKSGSTRTQREVVFALVLLAVFVVVLIGAGVWAAVIIVVLFGAPYVAMFRSPNRLATVRHLRPVPKHSRTVPQPVKIAATLRDQGRCRRCGSPDDIQYDHVVPFSLGGRSDDVSNIQLLCGRCNRRKSNRYIG